MMNKKGVLKYDFVIVGSGFAGSVLGMCLSKTGYSVCILEKEKHPRFAIGESSTPIADMVLRKLSDEFNLPFLSKISRYGEWQRNYPEIGCGLKRGFSYYFQKPGEEFAGNREHSKELLVAASVNDENSDTNWLRSDVDHFLTQKASEEGITVFEKTEIIDMRRNNESATWEISAGTVESRKNIQCSWLIDATGSNSFSQKFLGTKSSSESFETNSRALYSHFEGVPYWLSYLESSKTHVDDYPYNPDHSALHQLLEEGWMWMLRFNSGKLSTGILLHSAEARNTDSAESQFFSVIRRYPSLKRLFKSAQLSKLPGTIVKTGRLQRKLNRVFGDGWIAMNHTGGFVDPLHSTGIAHTLCTVEKIVNIFKNKPSSDDIRAALAKYADTMFREIELIDLLVSAGYMTRRNFRLFTAAVMLYFVASVRYEQSRLKGIIPAGYLCADEPEIEQCIRESFYEIKKAKSENRLASDTDKLIQNIKQRITPLNKVGLMDESKMNMYTHTAVEM